ncbi:hypothetical protein [Acinetobacter calcoaceticus]|uniref:hypothetical protein n=1 Tax=Acinetobacter calcoaceticus TaxID=471 RepID=UPI0018DDF08B|nr:hypothetical protein [Acinetobacter calcoaceticus]
MRELCFTDIYGKEHKIKVIHQTVSYIEVPVGFDHYITIDQPLSITGDKIFIDIGDVFLNKVTGELKTILQNGPEKFPVIGKLNT